MAVSLGGLTAAGAGMLFLYAGIKGKSLPAALQALISGKSPSTASSANPINSSSVSSALNAAVTSSTSSTTLGSSSSSGSSGTIVSGGGSAQAILQRTAAQFGWTGSEWQALQNVEMSEAGFNPLIRNPGGAFGLAQALGHGTGNTTGSVITYTVSGGGGQRTGTVNEYGGFGLSDAQARAANSGDAAAQALWMCNYIKGVYGTPSAAWAHEQSHNWY